jgi:hypothetical protein
MYYDLCIAICLSTCIYICIYIVGDLSLTLLLYHLIVLLNPFISSESIYSVTKNLVEKCASSNIELISMYAISSGGLEGSMVMSANLWSKFISGHLFLIIIDAFLYLCLSGWSIWEHHYHTLVAPSFVIHISKHCHHHQCFEIVGR